MVRFLEWLWGHKFGPAPIIRSWHLGIDTCRCADWREWGITFVTLGDRKAGGTSTPIWNLVWLRNRLGFPYKTPDYPPTM